MRTGKIAAAMAAFIVIGSTQAQAQTWPAKPVRLVIPFADLQIGVTALYLDYELLTANVRHFEMIPGLAVRRAT